LVVVSETADSHYRGFWIPDIRKDGATLPGAPRALLTGTGQAVIVDDLPPLRLDEEVEARWRRYLRGDRPGHFQGTMFVSVPVFRVEANQPMPSAILNVNVVSDRIWKRAYSRHWLNVATRRVSAWASTAWHATGLAFELQRSRISQGSRLEIPMLRALEPAPPSQLPAGGNDDEDA
jgi:hypothetical protein